MVDVRMVLNTPLKTFRFIRVFLINNSSRRYLCISSSRYIAIVFIAKKNLHMGWDVIKTFILSKPFKFFWTIILITKPDCWIPFQKKKTFKGIFRYALRFLRRCLWKHRYRQALVKLRSVRKNFILIFSLFKSVFFVFFSSQTNFKLIYSRKVA